MVVMKRILLTATFLIAAAGWAFAETFTGTVVDVMCKGNDLASHTRQCALSCADSGFGLVQADGKFLKFDEAGNARALAALKKSSKEKDLKAKVTGKIDGELIKVESIEIQP
jgi:hypothetical protein